MDERVRKRFLVFGINSSLAKGFISELYDDYDFIAMTSKVCDVTNEENIKYWCDFYDYDGIIYMPVVNIDGYVHRQTEADITKQFGVNVHGFLSVLRHSTEKMRNNKFGRVIYFSSILAKNPIKGTGIYSASKAFCDNIIKTYSKENSKYGITANSIQVGYFDAGLTNKISDKALENIKKSIPLGRLGNSKEIVMLLKTIIETEYINGSTLTISGGYE